MRIIVNADDFGLNHNRNVAVDLCFKNKHVTQGSIIVNTDFSDEGIQMGKDGGYLPHIGLHINLTYGKPLTKDILDTDYCENGLFVSSNPRSKDRVFRKDNVEIVRKELNAQFEKFFDYKCTFHHVDAHNDILFNREIWEAIRPLLSKYKIAHIRGVEPYLMGYYRHSIPSYLPIKYYFLYRYLTLNKIGDCKILHGGRNVNQFYVDYELLRRGWKPDRLFGNLKMKEDYEVITHPDFQEGVIVDLTNFDKDKKVYAYSDTVKKLSGFEKITYNEL